MLIVKHVPLPAISLAGTGRDTSVLTVEQDRRATPLYRECMKPSHPAGHSPHWQYGTILRGNGQGLGRLPDPKNTLNWFLEINFSQTEGRFCFLPFWMLPTNCFCLSFQRRSSCALRACSPPALNSGHTLPRGQRQPPVWLATPCWAIVLLQVQPATGLRSGHGGTAACSASGYWCLGQHPLPTMRGPAPGGSGRQPAGARLGA